MKVFWALIGLLVLGTVGLLASGALSGSGHVEDPGKQAFPALPMKNLAESGLLKKEQAASALQQLPPPQADSQPGMMKALDQSAANKPSSDQKTTPPQAAADPSIQTPVAPVAEPDNAAEKPKSANSAPASSAPETPAVIAEAGDDSVNPLIAMRKEIEAQRVADAAQRDAQKAAASSPMAASDAATAPTAESPATADAPFAGAKVETKADGSLLIDGKYTMKGKGTQEEPYKVTWDQLLSAQNEYAPKEGRKTIPPRIQALNDKWLDITGYVAFPLMTTEADELLSMMNQWDGCCIGVPPTPYDAVEVRLANAVSGNARLTTYGSVRGKFKVDPHLVGGWLVGLYVMDQAKLTPVSYGGIAP